MKYRLEVVVTVAYALLGLACVLPGCSREPSLYQAVMDDDVISIKKCSKRGVNLNQKYMNGLTPLLVAIENNKFDAFQTLLERGADPNKLVLNGVSVMHETASLQDAKWLKLALKHGGNPNLVNTGNHQHAKSTPIFYALWARSSECVSVLVEAKANLDWKKKDDDIPLIVALGHNRYDFVLLFLEAGADYNQLWTPTQTLVSAVKIRTPDMCSDDEQRMYQAKVKQWLKDHGAL